VWDNCCSSVKNRFDSAILTKVPGVKEEKAGVGDRRLNVVPSAKRAPLVLGPRHNNNPYPYPQKGPAPLEGMTSEMGAAGRWETYTVW